MADWGRPHVAGSDAGLEEESEALPGAAAARLRSLAQAALRNSEPACFKVYCEARPAFDGVLLRCPRRGAANIGSPFRAHCR